MPDFVSEEFFRSWGPDTENQGGEDLLDEKDQEIRNLETQIAEKEAELAAIKMQVDDTSSQMEDAIDQINELMD